MADKNLAVKKMVCTTINSKQWTNEMNQSTVYNTLLQVVLRVDRNYPTSRIAVERNLVPHLPHVLA